MSTVCKIPLTEVTVNVVVPIERQLTRLFGVVMLTTFEFEELIKLSRS